MRTNIDIDDALMSEAQKVSGHTTKKQTVERALRLMIKLRSQQEVAAHSASTAGGVISPAAESGRAVAELTLSQRVQATD